MNNSTKYGPLFVEVLLKTGALESIKNDPLLISEKLIESVGMAGPNYTNWFAKKKWTILEASCLFHGIDLYIFEEINRDFATSEELAANREFADDDPSDSSVSIQKTLVTAKLRSLLNNIYGKAEIMLTWVPKHNIHGKDTDDVTKLIAKTEEDPLKLINTYLLTIGIIPEKLLKHAEKSFLLLYQSRETNEDTRKNWQDNWHTIAPPFKELIEKSVKDKKKDISPRKEETLLVLIGVLADKYFVGNKYKKPNGTHKISTIVEDIIDYISKQFSDNHIPHGFKKSNLIEIINNSLDCWKKKKEV